MMIISTVSTNLTNVWGSICGRNKHISTIFQRENKVGRWSFNVSIHFWVWLEMLNSQDIRITKDNNWTDSKSIRIKQEYLNLHANFLLKFCIFTICNDYRSFAPLPTFLVLSVSWAQDIRRYNTNGKMNKFRAMNTQNLQASFSSLKL